MQGTFSNSWSLYIETLEHPETGEEREGGGCEGSSSSDKKPPRNARDGSNTVKIQKNPKTRKIKNPTNWKLEFGPHSGPYLLFLY